MKPTPFLPQVFVFDILNFMMHCHKIVLLLMSGRLEWRFLRGQFILWLLLLFFR